MTSLGHLHLIHYRLRGKHHVEDGFFVSVVAGHDRSDDFRLFELDASFMAFSAEYIRIHGSRKKRKEIWIEEEISDIDVFFEVLGELLSVIEEFIAIFYAFE